VCRDNSRNDAEFGIFSGKNTGNKIILGYSGRKDPFFSFSRVCADIIPEKNLFFMFPQGAGVHSGRTGRRQGKPDPVT
jgi:hypothetical protein